MTPLLLIFTLLAIGIVLLGAELFLPTHGLLGVLGGIVIIASIGRALFYNQWLGVAEVLAVAIATPFAWSAAVQWWPRTPIGRKMVLPPVTVVPQPPNVRLGQTGTAVSALRPAGTVDFNGATIEAAAQLGVIETGTVVVVTAIQDRRPIVQAVQG